MSLNGMLGIAIGAQGSGEICGSFLSPGVNEINLTRTSGAGSLAHEFGHALDHYFANLAGKSATTRPFLTEHTLREIKTSELRPEMFNHFKAIVRAMQKRQKSKRELDAYADKAKDQSKKNVESWLRHTRQDFKGQETEFDKNNVL